MVYQFTTKEQRVYNGKSSLQHMALGKPDSCMQNDKNEILAYSIHKINSKWITDSHVNYKTAKRKHRW